MSIEGGGVSGGGGEMGGIGSAVSVGPAISAGPSLGPSAGGLSFSREMSSFSIGSSLVNEGPVGGSFSFAEFKPLGVPNIVNEGSVTPESLGVENNIPPISTIDVIAEAQSIISQAQKPTISSFVILNEVKGISKAADFILEELYPSLITQDDRKYTQDDNLMESVIAEANYWLGIVEPAVPNVQLPSWQPEPQILPVLEPMPIGVAYPKAGTIIEEAVVIIQQAQENYPVTQPAAGTNSLNEEAVLLPNLVPEQIESEVLVKEQEEEKQPEEAFDEELILEQKVYLEDEAASAQRKQEIREAILKARTEADRLGFKKITGWLVAQFLPSEHEGNRSQVVKKTGPDGSYQETIEEVARVGELESAEQAVVRLNAIVDDKQPVRFGKEGKRVKPISVARVFKYRIFKPAQPRAEVTKRIVKKKEQVVAPVSMTEWKSKKESNLEDYPKIAEIFSKAA